MQCLPLHIFAVLEREVKAMHTRISAIPLAPVAGFALVISSFFSATAMPQAGTVEVTIHVQEADGKPIEGATVYIDKGIVTLGLSYKYKADTKEDGNVVFSVDASYCKGGCYASVFKSGFARATPLFHLDDPEPITITLARQVVAGTVEVTIHVQGADGKPIGGATVYIDKGIATLGLSYKYKADTKEDGNVVFSVDASYCKSGCYASIYKSGFAKATPLFHLDDAQPITVALARQAVIVTFHVTVQGALNEDVPGAYIKMPPPSGVDITGNDSRSPHATTDANGRASIELDTTVYMDRSARAIISKEDFEQKQAFVSWQGDIGTVPMEVSLKKTVGVKVTVTVNADDGPLADARVELEGSGLEDIATGTTTGGAVTLSVTHGGKYTVRVSHDGFETFSADTKIKNPLGDDNTQNLGPYTLKKKTGDLNDFAIEVLVTGKNESGQDVAIKDATISSGHGPSVTSDPNGHAKLKGKAAYQTEVQVKVEAQGYKAAAKPFTMSQPTTLLGAQGGSMNFDLERASVTTVDLDIEVKDKKDDSPVKGAKVTVQAISPDAAESSPAPPTGNDGLAHFTVTPALIKQGLRAIAKGDDFDDVWSDVPQDKADQPKVSLTIFVTRGIKREEVLKEINGLRVAIQAMIAMKNQLSGLMQVAQKQSDAVAKATGAARIDVDNLEAFVKQQIEPTKLKCQQAAEIKKKLELAAQAVADLETATRNRLDNAEDLAQKCSTKIEADLIKSGYESAIKATGDAGAIQKAAAGEALTLQTLLDDISKTKNAYQVANQLADKIADEVGKAHTAKDSLDKTTQQAGTIAGKLTAGVPPLLAQIDGLRKKYPNLPHDLDVQVTELSALAKLAQPAANVAAELKALVDDAKENLKNADDDKGLAGTLINMAIAVRAYGGCSTTAADSLFQKMDEAVVSLTVEIAAAADLPSKAEACEKNIACAPQMNLAADALKIGDIDKAKTLIDKIKEQSCDTRDLEEEYGRVLAKIKPLLNRVQDAYEHLSTSCDYIGLRSAAQDLQEAFPQHPWVVQNLPGIVKGASAKFDVDNLLQKATGYDDKDQPANAEAAIAQAQQLAAPYACIKDRVERFNAEYERGKSLKNKIGSLNSRINELVNRRNSAQKNSELAATLANQAAQLLTQINSHENQISTVPSRCRFASSSRTSIEGQATDTGKKEQAIRANLDAGINAMAIDPVKGTANCAAAADMQAKYNQAIKDVGSVGANAKLAKKAEADLENALDDVNNAKATYRVANQESDSLAETCGKVSAAVDAVRADVQAGEALKTNFDTVAAALRAEIDKLRADYPLPTLYDSEIAALYSSLDSAIANSKNVSFAGFVDAAASQGTRCDGFRASAQAQMQKYQNEIACDVKPATDLVSQMDDVVSGLGIELAAAADAAKKASECLSGKTPIVKPTPSNDVPDDFNPGKRRVSPSNDVPDDFNPGKRRVQPTNEVPDDFNPGKRKTGKPTTDIPDIFGPVNRGNKNKPPVNKPPVKGPTSGKPPIPVKGEKFGEEQCAKLQGRWVVSYSEPGGQRTVTTTQLLHGDEKWEVGEESGLGCKLQVLLLRGNEQLPPHLLSVRAGNDGKTHFFFIDLLAGGRFEDVPKLEYIGQYTSNAIDFDGKNTETGKAIHYHAGRQQ
jgi:hypothetical protein